MEICGDAEMWNRWSHTHIWWIKIGRYTLGPRDPSLITDHPAQGSSTRKISPHNFLLKKSVGVGTAEETVGFSGIFS